MTECGSLIKPWARGREIFSCCTAGGGSANSWNGFIRALDPGKFRAIAFDIRGHGDSDNVTAGFTDERFARDALAVAECHKRPKIDRHWVQHERTLCAVLAFALAGTRIGSGDYCWGPGNGHGTARRGHRRLGGAGRGSREAPASTLMFAVSPDPKLLDEYADDAAKASRHALEATLRMLLTSFEDRIKGRSPLTPTLALAGRSDMLLGADVQRAIAAIIQSAR